VICSVDQEGSAETRTPLTSDGYQWAHCVIDEIQGRTHQLFAVDVVKGWHVQRIEAAAELRQLARGVQPNATSRAEAVCEASVRPSGWNPLIAAKHILADEQLELVAAYEKEPRTRLAAG
jgi:hypothetical protein